MDKLILLLTENKFPKSLKITIYIIFSLTLIFDIFLIIFELLGKKYVIINTIGILLYFNVGLATLSLVAYIQAGREKSQLISPFKEIVTNWENSHSNYNRVRLFGEFKQLLNILSKVENLSNPKDLKKILEDELPSAFWTTQYESAYSCLLALKIINNKREINKENLKEINNINYQDLF